VCQVFYEVFDHIGPQLRWWAWNPGSVVVNQPAMASVPLQSALLFASVSLAAMTYLVVRLAGTGRWFVRAVIAGVLTPLAMVIAGLPSSLAGTNITAQSWVLGTELALVWLAGAWIIATSRQPLDEPLPAFTRFYPACYLAVMAALWISALPSYLAAENGVTADGTPTGSGLYALACFVGAGLVLASLHRVRRAAPAAA
jgi:hypothetical protein